MTYTANAVPIDTSDMPALHQVFRKALTAAPALASQASTGGTASAAAVGSYYDNVLRLLKVHHEGEEEVIWPRLRERCPEDLEMVSRMKDQHDALHDALGRSLDIAASMAKTGSGAEAPDLEAALGELKKALVTHLDDEEAHMLPVCGSYISQEEWQELPRHGMAHFDGDKVWLILGLILDNMSPAQQQAVIASMPPPAVQMWQEQGKGAYTAFMAQLGTGA